MEKLSLLPMLKIIMQLFSRADVNHRVVDVIEDAYERNYLIATKQAVKYVGMRSGGNINIANGNIQTEAEQKIERQTICDSIMLLP